MERLKCKKWLILAVAALSLVGLLLPLAASANDVTVSMVAPDEVVEGGNFTAVVNISTVVGFDSCDYYVTYDPAVVEVVGVSNGLINGTEIPVENWGFIPPPDTQGTIRVIENLPDVTGVSGEGYLAEIDFHVLGSACNTTSLDLHDGTLNNIYAEEIPASWIDDDEVHVVAPEDICTLTVSANPPEGGTVTGGGSYNCGSVVPITAMSNVGWYFDGWTGTGIANPTEANTTVLVDCDKTVTANFGSEITVTIVAPAEVLEGGDFIARVNISAVEDFDSCDYYVTYDPAVIEVTDVTNGLIDGTEIPVDSWGFIPPPDTQGTIRVIENLPGVTGVSGEGYLAEIHFDVVGSACNNSELDLHDGTLNDIGAIPIPAVWVDDSVHVYEAVEEITYNCTLAVGWNYISLPLIPEDDDIEVVLASLEGKYDQIWAYVDGEWQVYLPGQPDEYYIITGLTKLEKVADGLGYAIKMTEVGNLTGTGLEIEIGAIVPPTYSVSVSWNLVGFKTMDFNSDGQITQGADTMKARHYLKTMDQDADGEIIGDEVWYLRFYDPGTGQFYELYDSSNMLVCRGYWLYARVAGEISPPIEPEL